MGHEPRLEKNEREDNGQPGRHGQRIEIALSHLTSPPYPSVTKEEIDKSVARRVTAITSCTYTILGLRPLG